MWNNLPAFFFSLTFCFACAVLFFVPVVAATRFTYLHIKKKEKASAVYCSPGSGTCGAKQAGFTCFAYSLYFLGNNIFFL